MIDVVDQTLHVWRTTPFNYGTSDCMLSIGDYIALRGGRDVTDQFRGRYIDHAGAMALMAAHGGAAGLIEMTGIARIEGEPQRGDVVAIETDEADGGAIGALCTGDMIAVRLQRSVIEVRRRFQIVTGVWRCPS